MHGNTVTLDAGQKDGVHPGLELEIYREGREIKHPRTGELLGRSEEPLGRVRITSVQEAFSQATTTAAAVKPGDRFRASSGKVNVVLLPLLGGVRESLIEASIQELVERLGATGRFRVSMGDPINVYLSQEGIKAEDFLQGKGVQQAAQRFKVENLLAIHFKRVQNKPYMEVRFYAFPGRIPRSARRSSCRRPSGRPRDRQAADSRLEAGRRIHPRPSRDRSWPGCSAVISRPARTRAGKEPFRCARWPSSTSRFWPWTWRWRQPTGSLAWWSATAIRSTCTRSSSSAWSRSGRSRCAFSAARSPSSWPTSTGTEPSRSSAIATTKRWASTPSSSPPRTASPPSWWTTSTIFSSPSISRVTVSSRRCGPSGSARPRSSLPVRRSR